jgi:hypothetical protein
MIDKKKRIHNPDWHDNTRTERANRRKAELQAAAERDGFENWSQAMTAWKNGEAILVRQNKPLQE